MSYYDWFTLNKQESMKVKIIPPTVKYNPFLKTVVLGKNIKNAEKTKKSNEIPKKILRKNNGSLNLAL